MVPHPLMLSFFICFTCVLKCFLFKQKHNFAVYALLLSRTMKVVQAHCHLFNIFKRATVARSLHGLREPVCPVLNKAPKCVKDPGELFQNLKSGQNIFIQGGAMTPTPLVKALYNHACDNDLVNLKTFHIHTEGEFPINDENVMHRFRSVSLFTGKRFK